MRHSCTFTSRATTKQGRGNFCTLAQCSRSTCCRRFPTNAEVTNRPKRPSPCRKPTADMQNTVHLRVHGNDSLYPPFWLQGAPSGRASAVKFALFVVGLSSARVSVNAYALSSLRYRVIARELQVRRNLPGSHRAGITRHVDIPQLGDKLRPQNFHKKLNYEYTKFTS